MRPWEANIRKVVPYVPGDQPGGDKLIKLNTNENPYPPAPGAIRALRELETDRLRKYPDPAASMLVEALAGYYGVGSDQVFVGVGSDDVIAMSFLTFFNSDKPVLFPDITYSFYKVWADLYRIPYETPALDGDFNIIPEDYEKENGGVIFPNPNAPTGIYMPLEQVEGILKANQDVVVIVVQTFSKSRSMAGMRLGFATGNQRLIRALNDVKYSYNSYTMNLTSIVMGAESVRDEAYFKETTDKIIATRERAKTRLRELGFTFPDSRANFIFASHPCVPACKLFEALKEEQIYVRYFGGERLCDSLRISIGSDEEMDVLFAFLERYLKDFS